MAARPLLVSTKVPIDNTFFVPSRYITAMEIIRNAVYKERLVDMNLLSAVMSSLGTIIPRNQGWLNVILSRWSTITHTFVTGFGEITPTLADDGLSIFQRKASRYKGVQILVTSLLYPQRTLSEDGLGYLEQTLHRVDGLGRNNQHHLANCMAMWLSRFVFVEPPSDGVNSRVFPLAAVLQLDSIKACMERSLGRYDVPIFLCTPFLKMFFYEMFFYERYPTVSPKPGVFGTSGNLKSCSARWMEKHSGSSLPVVIDSESEFIFRPYP
ncbi:hypothetical protein U1Q18_014656 [Sarracenia purpurea var. burkii]